MEDRKARFNEISYSLSRRYLNSEEYRKAVKEIFTDPEERQAYLQRGLEHSLPHLVNPSSILTPAQFIEIPREPSLPLNRRALNLLEESTKSAESDDIKAPGFIFHELGVLQCLECEIADKMPITLEEGDDCEGDWEPTGFCVVARLNNTCHIDGVYVIYNMNPRKEGFLSREQVIHGAWGIPPSSPGEQFSCARIGSTMRDFGFKVKLAWSEQIHHPVELVWAVRSSMGGAIRATVDGNYKADV
ncbi:hypothetical protein ACHAQJ_003294 [Trichoderma viride]